MKCPFELPINARLGKQFAEGFYRKIEDKNGNAICLVVDFEKAPYIVQAVNSHDQFKNHFSHIDTCLMIMANTRTEEGLRDLPKLANDLRKYVRQAREEAEKE